MAKFAANLDLEREVLSTVKAMPWSTVRDVATLLDYNVSTIRSCLYRLEERGDVISEVRANSEPDKRGRKTTQHYALGNGTPRQKRKPEPVAIKTSAGLVPLYSPDLVAELKELREWKAWAIRLHPDLDITPVTWEARRLLAKQYSNGDHNEIMAGKRDSSPAMKALIEALS